MSYDNPRIKSLTASLMDIIVDFAEGNPGAVNVLCLLIKEYPKIDPAHAFKALGALWALDNLDLYGSNIWLLYKDVCKSSLVNMATIFRAIGYGILSDKEVGDYVKSLNTARREDIKEYDFPALLKQVQEKIPSFAKDMETTV